MEREEERKREKDGVKLEEASVIWGWNNDVRATLNGFEFRFAIPMTQVASEPNSTTLFTNYCIVVQVVDEDEKWTVLRRLTHFYNLNKLIKKSMTEQGLVFKQLIRPLPKKRYFDSFKTPVIRQRKRQLLEYLQDVLRIAERDSTVRAYVCAFLDINEDELHQPSDVKLEQRDLAHIEDARGAGEIEVGDAFFNEVGQSIEQQRRQTDDEGGEKEEEDADEEGEAGEKEAAHDDGEATELQPGMVETLQSTFRHMAQEESNETKAPEVTPKKKEKSKAKKEHRLLPSRKKKKLKSPKNRTTDFEPERKTKIDSFVAMMTHPIKQGWTLRQRWMSLKGSSSEDTDGKELHQMKNKHVVLTEVSSDTDQLSLDCSSQKEHRELHKVKTNVSEVSFFSTSGPSPLDTSTTSEDPGVTLLSGFLVKRGGFRGGRKSWKRRFFQLRDRCLFYYSASAPTLLGCMPLGDSTGIVMCMDDEQLRLQKAPPGKFGFIVSTPDRDLSLCADTEEERDDWMRAIRNEMMIGRRGPRGSLLGNLDTNGGLSPTHRGKQEHQDGFHASQESPTSKGQPDAANDGFQLVGDKSHALHATKASERASKPSDSVVPGATTEEEKSHNEDEAKGSEMALMPTTHAENTDPLTKEVDERRQRFKRHPTPSFPSSLKVDQEQDSSKKIFKEEQGLDAPDLQKRDPWEVDWNQLELRKRIGHGAFGQVYRGMLWGSEVAVKKLHCEDLSASALRSLRKEVTILSQLRHPCVVLYIGACTQPPNVCMITEWCSRGSLYDVLHNSSIILDTRRRIDICLQIAKGMSYLHSRPKQIIHRDLKSMNVLITQAWQARVADFGLTIVRRKSEFIEEDEGGHFGIQGTPQWMAPEIMEGDRYNCKVDVYSFGIMLTEVMTRKMPFADRYKGFDFVDAVLEGATPTIPAWACSSVVEEYDYDIDKNDVDGLDVEVSQELPTDGPRIRFRRRSNMFLFQPEAFPDKIGVHVAGRKDGDDDDDDEEEEEEEEDIVVEESLNDDVDTISHEGDGISPSFLSDYRQYRNSCRARGKSYRSESLSEERHPKNIQSIIMACLSRDPRSRPTFQDLVVGLNKLLENNSDDMLEYFDLPRLHELLEVGTLSDASMAALELTRLCHRIQHASGLGADEFEVEEDESTGEYFSMTSMSNNKRQILVGWASPLIVRIVERLTRETDKIITTRGDKVFVHIPERILAELGVSLSVLLQVCSSDDGVTMQAANIILDQGALRILCHLFLFADAAQDFERVKVTPSVYDHEAELEQVLKNRNPDYNSLLRIGMMLSYLSVTCQGRVTEAITKTLLEQLTSVDTCSHLSTRAKSRCESAGIMHKADGTISYHYTSSVLPPWVSPLGDPMRARGAIRSFKSGSGSALSASTSWSASPVVLSEQVEDLKEENHKLLCELAELRREMDRMRALHK